MEKTTSLVPSESHTFGTEETHAISSVICCPTLWLTQGDQG